MFVYSNTPLEKFANDMYGTLIRIRWNEQIIQVPNQLHTGMQDEYQYNEATIDVGDSRSVIIERIIGSSYTTGGEFAVINNKEIDPTSYAEYQAFRLTAKELADEYLATLE